MAKNILRAIQLTTHNGVATLLLYRIRGWITETNYGVVIDGEKWIYKSLAQWADEVGISPSQCKRWMEFLRKADLVVTMNRMLNGRLILHVKLTSHGHVICGGAKGHNWPDQKVENDPTEGSKSTLPYKTEEKTQEQTKGKACELHSPGSDQVEYQGFGKMQKEKKSPLPPFPAASSGETNMKKAKQVKSVHEVEQAVKANALLHKPATASAIVSLWRDEMHALTGADIQALTGKQAGQLKMFADKCEAGTAEAVLSYVMKHWLEFTIKVAGDVCLKSTPDEPHIGFILQYVAIAIMVAFPPAPPKQEAPVPKVAPPTMQSIAKAVKEYPQTLEELWALPPSDGE